MLQQVLSQLAGCSTNTVNIGFVERGDNGSSLNIEQVVKISKLVARFFERMENHILRQQYMSVNVFLPNALLPPIKLKQMSPLPVPLLATGRLKAEAQARCWFEGLHQSGPFPLQGRNPSL